MTLTFACWGYDRTEALRSGAIEVKGFDVEHVELIPRHIFDRMGNEQAFSAAEFSFTEYVLHYARGDSPFVAIPAFPSKMFRHGTAFINRSSGIRTPKDLEGRRVGVPLYTMTAALWHRGMLQDEYGVDWRSIQWVQGSVNEPGRHGNPTAIPQLLKPVDHLEIMETEKSLGQLLAEGAIDATLGSRAPDTVGHPNVGRLFPEFRAVERDYYIRTGIHPIMHLVAIRKDVHEANPGFAQALYTALCDARDFAMARMRYTAAQSLMVPFMAADMEEIDTVFGGDPWPYGIEANRITLETMLRYMVEQDYIATPIRVEELFLPVE
ncbi:MAG: ABC transporter substrate-binding protein [Alphaproteobacteria bacterium]|nr:ABC transporter substrate-binding protein [Alphaproteobacteria bacterium]